jgi:hypothetical protein
MCQSLRATRRRRCEVVRPEPASMLRMARPPGTPQPRAQRPVAKPGIRVKLYGYVTPEHYEKARTAAYSAGLSLGAYLTHLIATDEVDQGGRPLWAPGDGSATEELPMAM